MKLASIAASLSLAFTGAQAITLDFGNGPDAPTICAGNTNGMKQAASAYLVQYPHGFRHAEVEPLSR